MNAAQKTVIDTLTARAEKLTRDHHLLAMPRHGRLNHIIMCDGLPLTFTLEDGKPVNPRPCSLASEAGRFQRSKAHELAATITNGNGTQAVAMRLLDAAKLMRDQARETLATARASLEA